MGERGGEGFGGGSGERGNLSRIMPNLKFEIAYELHNLALKI